MVPTPDGVWHRDSHYWRKFTGRSTQHTDFSEGCSIKTLKPLILLGGLGALDPPISSPKKFRKNSSNFSLSKICNLCTPPYDLAPIMRILMPNPIEKQEKSSKNRRKFSKISSNFSLRKFLNLCTPPPMS